MTEFSEYLKMGFYHILDYGSIDHILFIAALTIGYGRRQMNKLILILTAFTVGHALTLALTLTDLIFLKEKYIEFLIPLTIVITGIYHLTNLNKRKESNVWIYVLTIFFGCIHGMGYASSFKSMFGSSSNIWAPLLEFNLGVELGQLLVAFIVFRAGRLIKRVINISEKQYNALLSGVVISLGIVLLIENKFW